MPYKKTVGGEIIGTDDFQKIDPSMQELFEPSQEAPTHKLYPGKEVKKDHFALVPIDAEPKKSQ